MPIYSAPLPKFTPKPRQSTPTRRGRTGTALFEPEIAITDANKFAGSAPVESWAFLAQSCQQIRTADDTDKAALGAAIGLGIAATSIDLVKVALNPVSTLIAAGLGWLTEHVGFLCDALDAVTGDPAATVRLGEDMHRAAESLRLTGQSIQAALDSSLASSWSGLGADEFRKASVDYIGRVNGAAEATDTAGYVLHTTGAVMAGVRALFRDLITTVLADIIAVWLWASVFAVITSGISVLLAVQYGFGCLALLTSNLSTKTAAVLAQSARSAARVGALTNVLTHVRPRAAAMPPAPPSGTLRQPPMRLAERPTIPPTRDPSPPANAGDRVAIRQTDSAATGPWMKKHEDWLRAAQPEQWNRLKYIERLISDSHPAAHKWLRLANDLDSAKEYLGWIGKPSYGFIKEMLDIRSSALLAWGAERESQHTEPFRATGAAG